MTKEPLDKIIIKKIFNTKKGKNFHRRGLQDNISEIKMNFFDHSIRFNPHDSIGSVKNCDFCISQFRCHGPNHSDSPKIRSTG